MFLITWPSQYTEMLDVAEYQHRHMDLDGCVVYVCFADWINLPNRTIELHRPADLDVTAYQLITRLRLDVVHFDADDGDDEYGFVRVGSDKGCAVSGDMFGMDVETQSLTVTSAVFRCLQMYADEYAPHNRCPDCGAAVTKSMKVCRCGVDLP